MRIIILTLALAVAACSGPDRSTDAKSIIATSCASCHVVPGVPGANGKVGPPLTGIAQRQVIAGYFPNTPANMQRWITHAQGMLPNNAMPDTNLTAEQAKIVTEYLYNMGK